MFKLRFRYILLLTALIGAISTGSVHAAGLKVPFGHTVNVNGNTVNVSGDVNNEGTLQTSTGAISLSGNWSNLGSFIRGSGTVGLNSTTNAQSVITGGAASAFNILTVLNTHSSGVAFADELYCDTLNATPGVQKLSFDNFGIHTITSNFNVNGSSGNLITLAPTTVSTIWSLNAPASTVSFLSVSYSDASPGGLITACDSNDGGNNTNWNFNCSPNTPPTAEAGDNLAIATSGQNSTTINGTVSDPDGDPVNYRWLEGATELLASTLAVGGAAPLDLSTLSPLSIGEHTLTLEADDGTDTGTDVMIMTIENSPPVVAPSGGGTLQLGEDIILSGQVADFDGDNLNYRWYEGATIFDSGSAIAEAGGNPVNLADHTIIGGLSLGNHVITLEADDEANTPVSDDITVVVIDTTDPTINATVSPGILWPPNHQMVDVVVQADAADNSGSVTLTASVSSSEPPDSDGDGNTIPDYTTPVINQSTGEITLQLRSERKGQGTGRTYTITVTATDDSLNSSDAIVTVVAPHDKGKK
jgi:hypothetical protein